MAKSDCMMQKYYPNWAIKTYRIHHDDRDGVPFGDDRALELYKNKNIKFNFGFNSQKLNFM